MWLVRLLETEGDWLKGRSETQASALSHIERQPGHAESDLCHLCSLSLSRTLIHTHTHVRAHTHTRTHKSEWGLWVYFKAYYAVYGVCVRKHIPLPWQLVHAPFPSPNRGKRSSMSSKETEIVQCKYTHRPRQAEPYIETVWPNEINRDKALCRMQHSLESKLWLWAVDGSDSWMEISAAVGQSRSGLYIWLWHIW